jgi:hypothetical protein
MLPCRGFLPTSKLEFAAKFAATNIAVIIVGVCWNPLTKSLAHPLRLFAIKEILIARLFVFPLLHKGVRE